MQEMRGERAAADARQCEKCILSVPEQWFMSKDEIIGPTQERMAKSPMKLSATDVHNDYTWRLDTECELDRLKESGLLEPDTERRYAAGIGLRSLYLRLYSSEGVGSYTKTPVHETGEMDDEYAWNFKAWLDTQRALPRYWKTLHTVCCEDARYPYIHAIQDALDELARHRQIG